MTTLWDKTSDAETGQGIEFSIPDKTTPEELIANSGYRFFFNDGS